MVGRVLGECRWRGRLRRAMDGSRWQNFARRQPGTVKNSKTVAYEFLRIRETEAGGIEYIAKPSGQSEASFLLVRLSDREVVFENPAHDFPQRIIYRLEAGGELVARIEGEVKGEVRTVDFPMKRVDCESQSVSP